MIFSPAIPRKRFAEDRAIHCFRHLQGTDSFQGGVKNWFRGAMRVPGEWVAAVYLPPPASGTPPEIQDLSKLHVNGQKDWNDKICDLIVLPGDAYDGAPLYFYDAGTSDRRWRSEIAQHPIEWRLVNFKQGFHTVRTEPVIRGKGRMDTQGYGAISSIWLNWPPK